MILTGSPLNGVNLDRLKIFLDKMGLEYEEGIEYSICILNDDQEITGTGSVDRNVLKCIAVDPAYQGMGISATIFSELVQYEFEHGRTHIFLYTKPKNLAMFTDMGFYPILQTEDILFMENKKNGFEKYIQTLKQETPEEALSGRCEIGAVVANCNPFTLGHKYLLEKALKQCSYLHLFLLSDDRSIFKPQERYQMVKKGIEGMERIILHWTFDYMISAATFPTYFFKDKKQGQKANCQLDLELFAGKIAPQLNIRKRFVGTEPNCQITRMYNSEMKNILPLYNIQIEEIERIRTTDNMPVSASEVRKYLACKEIDKVKMMVPEAVYYMLASRKFSKN